MKRWMPAALATCLACNNAPTYELLADGGGRGDAVAGVGDVGPGPRLDGGRDATPSERSIGPDAGSRDRFVPDTGPIPRRRGEGEPCTPSAASPQGSCPEADLVCREWNPPGSANVVASCIYPCETDADCAGPFQNRICGNVGIDLDDTGNARSVKACVATLVPGGATANVSVRHGTQMMGCAEPSQAYAWYLGSLLFDLQDDQLSCGVPCAFDMECIGANGRGSVCTLGLLPVLNWPGVCTTRRAGKGAQCSTRTITGSCDLESGAQMLCIDVGFSQADNAPLDEEYGVCLELCDLMSPACLTRGDPVLAPVCEFGAFTSPEIGLCSDGCSNFPDTCTGRGSPPRPGGVQNGMVCAEFSGMPGNSVNSVCLDVAQNEPLFTPFMGMNVPMEHCETDVHRCPDRTHCIPAGQQFSVCAYGCSTASSTSANGCENVGGTCTPFGATGPWGVCQ